MRVMRKAPGDKSDLTHLYTEEDTGPPYTVHLDQWFTRRKRFHTVSDGQGRVVFRSRLMTDILDWLDARECKRYTAVGGKRTWLVTLRAPSIKKEAKR